MTMTTNQQGRLENTTACLPIAYGSVAFYLGSKADEYRTHRWTLYVRSPDQTFDLGRAISKVIFQLHPSFPQPTRELVEPPFEVTETGWGELEGGSRREVDDSDPRYTALSPQGTGDERQSVGVHEHDCPWWVAPSTFGYLLCFSHPL